MQMGQVTDAVRQERAGRAALILAGEARRRATPHEVIDDELAAPVEQVEQARRTIRPGEDVVLLDLDHRQGAATGVERVFRPAGFLLLGQQVLTCGQPLISWYDSRAIRL